MEGHVKPAPDRINWGIFPGLKTISMLQIMCRFPEIEHLITILNWREYCGESVGN
jgi:hypothetical protein